MAMTGHVGWIGEEGMGGKELSGIYGSSRILISLVKSIGAAFSDLEVGR